MLSTYAVLSSAKTYDENAEYVHLWVPELAKVPAPQAHTPFQVSVSWVDTKLRLLLSSCGVTQPAWPSAHLSLQQSSEWLAQYDFKLGETYPKPIVTSLDNGRLPLKVGGRTVDGKRDRRSARARPLSTATL